MSKKPPRGGSKSKAKGSASKDAEDAALKDATGVTGESSATPELPDEHSSIADPKHKTRELPAFGFADEVLAGRRPEDSEIAPEGIIAESAEALPSPDDAERVYAFADTVSDIYRGEEEAAPRRITTWVTFDLAAEVFAIPVEEVHEVLRVSTITRVPHAPHPIRGVTNLRGRVIPVIDLRVRIDLPSKEIDRSSRILVVHPRGRVIGLLVDAVRQVAHLDLDAVQAPPDDVMTIQSDYLTGVYQLEDELLLLLDVERTLVIKESGAA